MMFTLIIVLVVALLLPFEVYFVIRLGVYAFHRARFLAHRDNASGFQQRGMNNGQ